MPDPDIMSAGSDQVSYLPDTTTPAAASGGDISGGYHITKPPPPLPNEPDASLLARLGVAEGGSSAEGQTAVIRATLQRAAESGKPIATLLTEPGQMQTYWNGGLQKVDPASDAYKSALAIAQTATPSPGIDSWYSPAGIKQQGFGKPPFDPSTGTMIGGQLFGKGYAGASAAAPNNDPDLLTAGKGPPGPIAQPRAPIAIPQPLPTSTDTPNPNSIWDPTNGVWRSPTGAVLHVGDGPETQTVPGERQIARIPGGADDTYMVPGDPSKTVYTRDPKDATLFHDPAGGDYRIVGQDQQSKAAVQSYLKANPLDPGNHPQSYAPVAPQAGMDPDSAGFDRAGLGFVQGGMNVVHSLEDAGLALRSNPVGNLLLGATGPAPTAYDRADLARGLLTRNANDLAYASSPAYGAGKFGGELAGTVPAMLATEGAGGALGLSDLMAAAPGASFISRAPGMLAGNVAKGALYGGEGAALTSAGSSAPLSQQIMQGAETGAVTNPLLAPLGVGARAGMRFAGTALQPFLPSTAADAATAAKRVGNLLINKIQADGQDPADVIAAAKANPTAPAFHAGGPNMQGTAEALVGAPGIAQRELTQAVAEHQAQAPAQIKADIGTALGGSGDYLDTLNKTLAARKAAADAGISAIADQPVTLNENAIQAVRSPLAQGAIKTAAQNALASIDPEVRANGAMLNRLADTALDNPAAATVTIRNAQDISRSLLEAAQGAFSSGDPARGIALKGLGRAIRSNAADPAQGGAPAYAAWLSKYGDDSDNIDALNLGHSAVFSGAKANTAAQVQQTLAGMGPGAQDYYRKGVAEALIDQTRTNGVNAMRQLLRNEDVQDKVQLAFGNDPKGQAAYDNFLDTVKQRVGEQNINSQVMGNSRTYARQAARADLETQPLHPLDVIPHAVEIGGHGVGLLAGNPASAAALSGKALKAVMANFPRADRSVVGNPLTNALLGRALSDPDALEQAINAGRSGAVPVRTQPNKLLSGPILAGVGVAGGQTPANRFGF